MVLVCQFGFQHLVKVGRACWRRIFSKFILHRPSWGGGTLGFERWLGEWQSLLPRLGCSFPHRRTWMIWSLDDGCGFTFGTVAVVPPLDMAPPLEMLRNRVGCSAALSCCVAAVDLLPHHEEPSQFCFQPINISTSNCLYICYFKWWNDETVGSSNFCPCGPDIKYSLLSVLLKWADPKFGFWTHSYSVRFFNY